MTQTFAFWSGFLKNNTSVQYAGFFKMLKVCILDYIEYYDILENADQTEQFGSFSSIYEDRFAFF